MSRRGGWASAVVALAMVVGVLVPASSSAAASGTPSVEPLPTLDKAVAANGADFDPGYIVSDENFYDGAAMDVAGVQAFINAKNAGCAAGVTCLRNYVQPTPTMPATAYCSAIPGAAWESAASIIVRVGLACGLSPRAMLVILQKEQGLVTATAPSTRAFTAATGFSCPDTAACDPAYGGFFYQVYYAARQYVIYKVRPQNFNHRPNAWNNVRLHPNAACGTSPVFIRNFATAGLYNYTPYQPNAAALANLYGTGDGCSSYGNRNFFRLWSDWFGSPVTIYGLVRPAGSSEVYLQSGSSVFPFSTPEIQAQYSGIGAVVDVSAATFAVWTVGAALGQVIQSTDGSRYVVDSGRRYRLINCDQAFDYALPCEGVPTIGANVLGRMPFAGNLNYTAKLPDGSLWLMQDGVRKQFTDPAQFVRFGISATPSALSALALSASTFGAPVPLSGLLWDGASSYKVITPAGVFDASTLGAAGWSQLATRYYPESMAQLVTTAPMPARLLSSGRYFVATPSGWLEVGAGLYGDTFTTLPAGAFGSIPIVARAMGAHFVRETSSTQRYFIGGGVRLAVSPENQAAIVAAFGVPAAVHVISDGSLTGVTERIDTSALSLVRETATVQVYLLASGKRYPIATDELLTLFSRLGSVKDMTTADIAQFPIATAATRVVRASSGEYLLLDSGRRFTFVNCPQVRDLGYDCATVPVLSRDQVNAYPSAGGLNYLVRRSDGTIWLMQGGTRRFLPDPYMVAPFGISPFPTVISDAAIDATPIGALAASTGVYTDGAGAFRVVDSTGRIFDVPAVHGRILTVRTLTPAGFALLPPAGTLPLRAESGGKYLIAVQGGWLQVDPWAYGGPTLFTTVPAGATSGSPVVRVQLGAHFAREQSSTQEWFIGGGVRLAVTPQMRAAIIAAFGVENRTWLLPDGALDGVPIRTV